MKTITLKSRIFILLTIFTVVTVALFVAVQLSHEINLLNRFHRSHAQIIYSVLKSTWDNMAAFPLPEEKKLDFLRKRILALKQSEEITHGYIYNRQEKIVFSTEKTLQGDRVNFDDVLMLDKLKRNESIEGEVVIDESRKTFSVYIPLAEGGKVNYIGKIFFSLAGIWGVYQQVYQPAFLIGILFIIVNIILGFSLSRLIIAPIKVFNSAAKLIASGRLDLRVNILTSDELEELASTFNFMTQALIKMKERAENANPLTKLPGNIVIREAVEERIKTQKKFTVVYCDLDNFKAFNDKYGIAKGDEAIKLTSNVFKEALKSQGNTDDFLGHEGGDDFIILTTPQRTQAIASAIIEAFNSRIRTLYDKEDLERGYIIAHGRDNTIQQFPLMTISLAGVTNECRAIASYAEVTNIAAEVKKRAKQECRSCFILDQRKD
ncbi:MAG: GGDEF domain-containing protein [Candidatus Omnitrophota bacterium]